MRERENIHYVATPGVKMGFLSSGMVDVIFADVAQPDQTRIVALNAHNFLKNGGHFVISIKVNRHTFHPVHLLQSSGF